MDSIRGPTKSAVWDSQKCILQVFAFQVRPRHENALLVTAHSVSGPGAAGRHLSTPAQGSRGPAYLVGTWGCSALVF